MNALLVFVFIFIVFSFTRTTLLYFITNHLVLLFQGVKGWSGGQGASSTRGRIEEVSGCQLMSVEWGNTNMVSIDQ